MDARRFDRFVRAVAGRASRRGFLGLLGAVGAALGLPGAAEGRRSPAGAAALLAPDRLQELRADHYQCYAVDPLEGFEPREVVLRDQFGEARVRVLPPDEFCAPVGKDGGPVLDPETHLTCYPIEAAQPAPPPPVVADNQFGSLRLQLGRPRRLCVPSRKRTDGGRANHYRCYRVACGPVAPAAVALRDQFEAEEVRLGAPEFLCAPVDKNGEGIADPAIHHLVYPFGAGPYAPRVARLDNQFGAFRLAFERAGWLFVPSHKRAVDGNPVDLPPAGPADHYKAYAADAEPFGPLVLELRDQFDSGRAAVGTPDLLLAPVDKNGEGVADAATHYVGYPFAEAARVAPLRVELANQFGELEVQLQEPAFLLVPSRKTLGTCENVFECDPAGFCDPAQSCTCVPTTEGGSLCHQGQPCDVPECRDSNGCPPGEVCAQTCCPQRICVRECGNVRPGAAARPPGGADEEWSAPPR